MSEADQYESLQKQNIAEALFFNRTQQQQRHQNREFYVKESLRKAQDRA